MTKLMFKQIVLSGLLFILTGSPAFCQETDSLKVVSLDEIILSTPVSINNGHLYSSKKDGQTRTEILLDAIPGVSILSRGNFAQEPVIRGMAGSQINILVDGMRIYGACTDRMDPASSYVEPNNLRRIKINHGPGFETGHSLGGGINFELLKPEAISAAFIHV